MVGSTEGNLSVTDLKEAFHQLGTVYMIFYIIYQTFLIKISIEEKVTFTHL